MLESKTYELIVLLEPAMLTIVKNEDCTQTLSSRRRMRYRPANERKRSLLIHELLWDNARRVLMHTSSVIAVPDLLILVTERSRFL